MSSNLPYVVLVGDVGVGKSLLVEKISGVKGISSKAEESVTRCTNGYMSFDQSFYIADTPGSNPIKSKFKHNINIAHALNFRPVSRIILVVKADTRIDNVVDHARKYTECFTEFYEFITICVTHMDTVEWEKGKCKSLIDQELGITSVIYSNLKMKSSALIVNFKALFVANKTVDITITSDNFLKYFKIHNNNLKILKSTKREVRELELIKQSFYNQQHQFQGTDQADLLFEFQQWVSEEIIEAQKRVSKEHQFDFIGPESANHAGHIANMTNQMKLVLYDIRFKVLSYQSDHGVSSLRKCPHCGLIWTKVEGCDGETTCGKMVSKADGKGVFAMFSFQKDHGNISIKKTGNLTATCDPKNNKNKIGCGKRITWKTMAPVNNPDWLNEQPVAHTEDVLQLSRRAYRGWNTEFNTLWRELKDIF